MNDKDPRSNQKNPLDFSTFVLSVSSAAFMGLGLVPRPGESKREIDLELAKQNIDLLELMHEKTRNNLTSDEAKLLEGMLFETRMKYVEIQKSEEKR